MRTDLDDRDDGVRVVLLYLDPGGHLVGDWSVLLLIRQRHLILKDKDEFARILSRGVRIHLKDPVKDMLHSATITTGLLRWNHSVWADVYQRMALRWAPLMKVCKPWWKSVSVIERRWTSYSLEIFNMLKNCWRLKINDGEPPEPFASARLSCAMLC